MIKYDVIIVGGGIVGLSLAAGLLSTTDLRIALIEARTPDFAWDNHSFALRVSAITPASKCLFERVGVWPAILQERVAPFTSMHVFDGESLGGITFSAVALGAESLGHIVENRVIHKALWDVVSQRCDVYCPVKFTDVIEKENDVTLLLDDSRAIHASLLVAADGAFSPLRKTLGVSHKERDYGHTAIVANIACEKPHDFIARQRFETTGPLALLPMPDASVCSMVWSQTHSEAQRLMALDNDAFNHEITLRFEGVLGDLQLLSERISFPLVCRHAEKYVQLRSVFIGDAAHTIHPLAGQGLNLGLSDVSELINVICAALDKNRDFAAVDTLRRYERAARARNVTMLAAMDAFRLLFGSKNPYVLHARSQGLSFCDKHRFLKSLFVPV